MWANCGIHERNGVRERNRCFGSAQQPWENKIEIEIEIEIDASVALSNGGNRNPNRN